MFRKTIKYILRLLGSFLLLIGLYLLVALILTIIPANSDFQESEQGIEIFVFASPIHTDLIVPVRSASMNLHDRIPVHLETDPDTGYQYVGFGWGDRDFYLNTPTWDDLKWTTALRSLLWPTPTVMHVTFFYSDLRDNAALSRIRLDPEQYEILLNHINSGFERDAEGSFIRIVGQEYSDQDLFYEAGGFYTLLYTCNNWTNDGLKRAGVKTSAWAPFSQSVMYHLESRAGF